LPTARATGSYRPSQKVKSVKFGRMDETFATLEELARTKNLLPAEQLLMSACHSIDPFLVSPISDDSAAKLFTGLFFANRGEYSLQLAIYIATKLFEISSVPKLWDVSTSVKRKTPPRSLSRLATSADTLVTNSGRTFRILCS
jgi:hypothetical protein